MNSQKNEVATAAIVVMLMVLGAMVPPCGVEPTREAAMAAFAKSWGSKHAPKKEPRQRLEADQRGPNASLPGTSAGQRRLNRVPSIEPRQQGRRGSTAR